MTPIGTNFAILGCNRDRISGSCGAVVTKSVLLVTVVLLASVVGNFGLPENVSAAGCGPIFGPPCPPDVPAPTLDVAPPKSGKPPNPRGMYRVEIVCHSHGTLPVETIDGLLRNNISASFALAIADQNFGTMPSPEQAKAYLSVYNVGGTKADRKTYVNDACNNHPFFVSTRKPLYVIAAATNISTRELGPFLAGLQSVLGIASSARPLFAGLPLPAGGTLSAIENTESRVGTFISSFNDGHSPIIPKRLLEGKTVINANYAEVDVNVTRLKSIVGLKNEQFTVDLEDMLDTMIKPTINVGMTDAVLKSTCSGAASQLKEKNNLSSEDIAYSMAYVARNAGLPAQQIIECLGKEYALIVARNFIHEDWSSEQKFTESTVRTVLPDNPVIPQPSFAGVKPKLIRLAAEMHNFTSTPSPPRVASVDQSLLKGFLSKNVEVEDLIGAICKTVTSSTNPTPGCDPDEFKTISSDDFMNKLIAAKFTKFGCFMSGSDSVAYMLAIQNEPKDTRNGYQLTDAVLMHVWVNDEQKAYRFLITDEYDVIGAAISNNRSYCQGVLFKNAAGQNPGNQQPAAPAAHP